MRLTLSIVLTTAALLMTFGCATKNYHVCVMVNDGHDAACLHRGLSKDDAINVGQSLEALGQDVYVYKRGGTQKLAKRTQPPAVQSQPLGRDQLNYGPIEPSTPVDTPTPI